MKSLNKYIKESILDDEDIIISNIKKNSDNPFYILANLNEEDKNNEELVLNIIKNLEFPKHIKEKERFNKDGLGVQMFLNGAGDRVYHVTYDKRKASGYNSMFPSIILSIFVLQTYKKDTNFLMDSKIRAGLGGYLDMKAIFGSNTPIKYLLKKWAKKYNILTIY